MGTEVLVGLAMTALSAGLAYENQRRTANKQDSQLAQSLRNQATKQRQADARVNEELAKLKESDASKERSQRLDDYMQAIRAASGKMTSGLVPMVGGEAFATDAAKAAEGVQDYATANAGLLSRIDAPSLQRQREGFGFGNLATDIGLIGREAQGQSFLDELRLRAIRRNPWMDMAAGVLGGMAGGMGGSTTNTLASGNGSVNKLYGGGKLYGGP